MPVGPKNARIFDEVVQDWARRNFFTEGYDVAMHDSAAPIEFDADKRSAIEVLEDMIAHVRENKAEAFGFVAVLTDGSVSAMYNNGIKKGAFFPLLGGVQLLASRIMIDGSGHFETRVREIVDE